MSSKISRLMGKPILKKIGDIELEIHPLVVEDLDLIIDLENPEKKGDAIKRMIYKTLKAADPEATDDELKNVGIKYFKELFEAIAEVNGLSEPTES